MLVFPLGAVVFLLIAGPYAMYMSAPVAGLSVDAVSVLASTISLAASVGFTLAFYPDVRGPGHEAPRGLPDLDCAAGSEVTQARARPRVGEDGLGRR